MVVQNLIFERRDVSANSATIRHEASRFVWIKSISYALDDLLHQAWIDRVGTDFEAEAEQMPCNTPCPSFEKCRHGNPRLEHPR